MQGWTLTRGAWSLWSEIRRHVNVMDSYLTIGCVMSMVLRTDICQEWAISRKASAPALQVHGAVVWPGRATTMSFHLLAKWWGVSLRSTLYPSYLQGGLATSEEFPAYRCPYLCFVLADERRQLVCLPNEDMACVGITWVSVCLSAAIMNTRGRVLRQLCECFTQFHMGSKIKE